MRRNEEAIAKAMDARRALRQVDQTLAEFQQAARQANERLTMTGDAA